MPECPICAADVKLPDDAIQGELIECEDCGCELEVISVDPAGIAEAPKAEEDWGQ